MKENYVLQLPEYRTLVRPIADASKLRNLIPTEGSIFGQASIEQGYPAETMEKIESGGVPPMGQDMNGLLWSASSGIHFLQAGGGYFKWNAEFVNKQNGYPRGAVIRMDNERYPFAVESTVNSNMINPNVDEYSIGSQWGMVQLSTRYSSEFIYIPGFIAVVGTTPYMCLQKNGYEALPNGIVAPGTNPDVWAEIFTSGGGGSSGVSGRTPVGMIQLYPFRPTMMPDGVYPCNGQIFATTSPIGQALVGLPESFRADWGIVLNIGNINLPNIVYQDGTGVVIRGVDGTSRFPGTYQGDASRPVTASSAGGGSTDIDIGGFGAVKDTSQAGADGSFYVRSSYYSGGFWSNSGPGHYGMVYGLRANQLGQYFSVTINQPGTKDTEVRMKNVGMVFGIYLGV
jgi:hypothetical protein